MTSSLRIMAPLLASLVCFAGMPGPASAWDLATARPYVTLSVGSEHIGGRKAYNEINPGLGFGLELTDPQAPQAFAVEAGRYKNSRATTSHYVMLHADRKIATLSRDIDLRLGLMAGLAHYPGAGDGFRRHGIPTIGDAAIAGGVSVAIDLHERGAFRIGAVPALDVADAILTFQIRLPSLWRDD